MTDSNLLCLNCRAPFAGITSISSPTPQLLGTNKVPSVSECQEIRESLAAVQSTISQLDDDIARVKHVLEQLIKEQTVLKEYADEHAPLITPARRLPVDIWSEIFSHCVPQEDTLWRYTLRELNEDFSFTPRHAPALLLQVCSGWRTIVLSSPTLWSLIPLHSRCTQVPPSVVRTWLRRSHQAGLRVIFKPSSDELFALIRASAARAVLEQSHRWQSVIMRLPIYSVPIFSLLKHNLPKLEELQIDFDPVSYKVHLDRLQELDIFLDAPKLRRVTIHRPPPFAIADIKLPWDQLTHFSSNQYSQQSCMNGFRILLQSAPQLQEVEWRLPVLASSRIVPLALQHHRLHSLTMTVSGNPGSAFEHLLLPSLRSLSIDTLGERWTWPSFEPFMLRSCRALESFMLKSEALRVADVIPCLKVLPSLCHLSLSVFRHSRGPIEELFQALSCASSGNIRCSVLLPRMKTIMISCAVPDGSHQAGVVSQFVNMVESRWLCDDGLAGRHAEATNHSGISRIETAHLSIPHCWSIFSVDPADGDRLQTLRSEGLEVEVEISGTFY